MTDPHLHLVDRYTDPLEKPYRVTITAEFFDTVHAPTPDAAIKGTTQMFSTEILDAFETIAAIDGVEVYSQAEPLTEEKDM